MPKEKEITNHPCHLLSLPSAKRFWCRHCMSVFEDAITRWRHSRSCRYGVVNNFMKRRELEAKALQNTTVLNPVEARLEQSIQMADLSTVSTTVQVRDENGVEILTSPEDFTCFICHQKFQSMEEMRHHVKYPCNASKIVTTRVPHPKHSVPVFIESVPPPRSWDQPGSVEIQQQASYIHEHSYPPQQQQQNLLEQQLQQGATVDVHMQDSNLEQNFSTSSVTYGTDGAGTSTAASGQEESKNLTPTTIYVNEKGETVIEVENLDLASDGGELSLAHLLTQLSQQGIVFDKTRSASLQAQDFVLESHAETTGEQQQQLQQPVFKVEGQDDAMAAQHGYYKTVQDQGEVMVGTETLGEGSAASVREEEEEEGQPTAEDAANTLAQLAGFRGYMQQQQQQHQEVTGHGDVIHNMQTSGGQAVEMIQLSNNTSNTIPVQSYQYTSPVNIHYTYPSHSSVVSTGQPQQQLQHQQVVGAQHMSLQEVLTAGTASQLIQGAEAGATEEDIKPEELAQLESVRYIVDPVTGHQVMQQVEEDSGLYEQPHPSGSTAIEQETSEVKNPQDMNYVTATEHQETDTAGSGVDHSQPRKPDDGMDSSTAAASFQTEQVGPSLVPHHGMEQQQQTNVSRDGSEIEAQFPAQTVSFQDDMTAVGGNVAASLNGQPAVTAQASTEVKEESSIPILSLSQAGPTSDTNIHIHSAIGETGQSSFQVTNVSNSAACAPDNVGSLAIFHQQDVETLDQPQPGNEDTNATHGQTCQQDAYKDLEEDIPAQPVCGDSDPEQAVASEGADVPTTDDHSEVVLQSQGNTDQRNTNITVHVADQTTGFLYTESQGIAESHVYAESQGIAESHVYAESQGIAESHVYAESQNIAETHVYAESQDIAESQPEEVVAVEFHSADIVTESEPERPAGPQPVASVTFIEPHPAAAAAAETESQPAAVMESHPAGMATVVHSESAVEMDAEPVAMDNQFEELPVDQHPGAEVSTFFVVTSTGIQQITREAL